MIERKSSAYGMWKFNCSYWEIDIHILLINFKVEFDEILGDSRTKAAASQAFYQILVLATFDQLYATQSHPYTNIRVYQK